MLDIESIKANWENAVIVASRNHSIGPIVMESLDDVRALIAELERREALLRECRSCLVFNLCEDAGELCDRIGQAIGPVRVEG